MIFPETWYYDRDSKPITQQQWGALRGQDSYYRIAEEYVGDRWVSTVWIGIDVGVGVLSGGPPEIFETMVFDGGSTGESLDALDTYTRRYSSEDAARAGHEETVTLLVLDAGVTP